jgi:hypothetical protein
MSHNKKQVVTVDTAREERNSAANQVVKLLGPALKKEREQNITNVRKIEQLSRKVIQLGKENDNYKNKKGGDETPYDLDEIKKAFGYILYEDVKDNLTDEERTEAEKYLGL